MSIRGVSSTSLTKRGTETRYVIPESLPIPAWERNPAWPVLAEPTIGQQKVVGLYAVYPGDPNGLGNYFTINCQGNYSVDHGNGVVVNVNSGVTREYDYDFNNAFLYDATVNFVSASNTIERNSHGYVNGSGVSFYRISQANGLSNGIEYYVINATANTFQVSDSVSGAAIDLTQDGTGSLLPYKIATVTIEPQAGANLTSIDLSIRHSITTNAYSTGWLDIAIRGSQVTSLTIGNLSNVKHQVLERAKILELGAITSFEYLFYECSRLEEVQIDADTSTVTSTLRMFGAGCASLTRAPIFDMSGVLNASLMFAACTSLQYVPQYDTGSVTDMSSMFSYCYKLETIPLLDTSNVTNMISMFEACYALKEIPPLDTSSVTNMSLFVKFCYALKKFPSLNTSLVQAMDSMFYTCLALESVPLLDTSNVTSMQSMFYYCNSLKSVPVFNTPLLTDTFSMFTNCYLLEEAPFINTSLVTDTGYMFAGCKGLKKVPLFDMSSNTTMNSMFADCSSLEYIPHFNTQSVTDFSYAFRYLSIKEVPLLDTSSAVFTIGMFDGCDNLETVPQFNTSNVLDMSSMFANCRALKSVPKLDTSSANLTSMFSGCNSLAEIPELDAASTSSLSNTFRSCSSLKRVALRNTGPHISSTANTFNGCSSLEAAPEIDTSAVASVSDMFFGCNQLREIPAYNLSGTITSSNMFSLCNSLNRVKAYGFKNSFSIDALLSRESILEIISNVGTVTTSRSITFTGNPGTVSSISKTLTFTSGSTTISAADTSGLSTGMFVLSGTGTGITSGGTFTGDVTANTFTRTNHGLPNGTKISFGSVGTITGLTTWTIYYVVNATANTIQVSSTLGGSVIDIAGTNASVNVRFPSFITAINPNVSVALSTPVTSSTTTSLTFSEIDASIARLRNWTVTF